MSRPTDLDLFKVYTGVKLGGSRSEVVARALADPRTRDLVWLYLSPLFCCRERRHSHRAAWRRGHREKILPEKECHFFKTGKRYNATDESF